MAIASTRTVFNIMVVFFAVVTLSQAAPLYSDGNHVLAGIDWLFAVPDPTTPAPPQHYRHGHVTSVHHFARHALCRTREQMEMFSRIMALRLCSVSASFAVDTVRYLCDKKDFMLDRWVNQMFDNDGDGRISLAERRQYDDYIEDFD